MRDRHRIQMADASIANHKRVCKRDRRHGGVNANLPQRPKNGERQDTQIHSGANPYVIRARALILCSSRVLKKRLFAENHGVHERSLRRRPELVNLGYDARMHARALELNPAAGKPGKPLNIRCLGRSADADGVVQ